MNSFESSLADCLYLFALNHHRFQLFAAGKCFLSDFRQFSAFNRHFFQLTAFFKGAIADAR